MKSVRLALAIINAGFDNLLHAQVDVLVDTLCKDAYAAYIVLSQKRPFTPSQRAKLVKGVVSDYRVAFDCLKYLDEAEKDMAVAAIAAHPMYSFFAVCDHNDLLSHAQIKRLVRAVSRTRYERLMLRRAPHLLKLV